MRQTNWIAVSRDKRWFRTTGALGASAGAVAAEQGQPEHRGQGDARFLTI